MAKTRKVCDICGKIFNGRKNGKRCSEKCRAVWLRNYQTEVFYPKKMARLKKKMECIKKKSVPLEGKEYKHVVLGWSAIQVGDFYGITNGNQSYTLPKDLVEGSSDWEEVEKKDWIYFARDSYNNSGVSDYTSFRNAIIYNKE